MSTARKPATRKPPRREEPQVRATLHWAYWRFLYRQYRKLDKFTLRDIDREPLAEVMAEAADKAEKAMQAGGTEEPVDPVEAMRREKAGEFGPQHATVWGSPHGFAVLTQWMGRELAAVAPSLTKNAWATCGMLLVPQLAAQDSGRGFEEQC